MKKETRKYNAVYQKRGRWFIGWVEEVPGVNVQEKTLKDARVSLQEALAMILEANHSYVVESKEVIREPVLYTLSR
ncbi:MAG: type II toxin-antitoxin system HicB family antitoxin [Patescibacteria group bacterium]